MSIREDYLTTKLRSYLSRRSMPRGLEGKPDAAREELESLVRCLCRYAPKTDYDGWWSRCEDRLDEEAQTRAWPTAGEIKKAAKAISPAPSKRISENGDFDRLKIMAGRIERGEPIGDEYLFGRPCVEMLSAGYVTMDQIRPYRSALFFSEKNFYGAEKANDLEAARLKRHEDAEATE